MLKIFNSSTGDSEQFYEDVIVLGGSRPSTLRQVVVDDPELAGQALLVCKVGDRVFIHSLDAVLTVGGEQLRACVLEVDEEVELRVGQTNLWIGNKIAGTVVVRVPRGRSLV